MELDYFIEVCEDIISTQSTNYKQKVISEEYNNFRQAIELAPADSQKLNTLFGGLMPPSENTEEITKDDIINSCKLFIRFLIDSKFKDPNKTTNVDENRFISAAEESFNMANIDDLVSDHGKVSIAVGKAQAGENSQPTFDAFVDSDNDDPSDELIYLEDIYDKIIKLEEVNSDKKREEIISDLFSYSSNEKQAKWISYCILGDISLYMKWKTAAAAMADAYNLSKDDVYQARYLTFNDLPTVVERWLDSGYLRSEPKLMEPFSPMLAEDEEISNIDDSFIAQPKLDGARLLIHSNGNELKVYTRRLKDVTEAFPEIKSELKPTHEFILDGEAVAYDPKTNEKYPFEKIMNRLTRENDIEKTKENVKAKIWLFDCIYDTELIYKKPFKIREERLENILLKSVEKTQKSTWDNGETEYITSEVFIQTPSLDNIEESYDISIENHEGIIAKRKDSMYEFGKEEWKKIKPTNTLELRVVDYQEGTGEYARENEPNGLGSLGLETKDGIHVGEVGTGFTDEEIEKWSADRKKEIIGKIIEIKAEGMSVTEEDGEKSYGLRFARFERFRPESDANVDTIEKCLDLLN